MDDHTPVPILESLESVQSKSVDWLWENRIAAGRITLLAGDPGLGKSWLSLDLAARVSKGAQWPDGAPCKLGNVLLMNCEDDIADVIRPRLDLLSADVGRITALTGIKVNDLSAPITLDDYRSIDAAISITEARLLIIDPIAGFFGHGADSNRDTYIRAVFRPLAATAERTGCAIVMVAHLNKSIDQSALYRFSGSVQFSGAARTAYYVGRDRADISRRLMYCTKNNLGPDQWAMAYRLDPEHSVSPMQWEPEEISGDQLEDVVSGGRENEDVKEAVEWLRNKRIGDRGESLKSIKMQTQAAGWGWQQVTRARRLLGMSIEHINGDWILLPASADPNNGRGWTDA